MSNTLTGRKIAILATDGFEQVELTGPLKALKDAGAEAVIVSLKAGSIQGMNHDQKGDTIGVDETLDDVLAEQFDGLVLPGGVANPDTLRMNPAAVGFVRDFVVAGKPIAAICHGPWTLIEAEAVRGKKITSWPSLKTDLRNAGAHWVDQAVVRDGMLVTSRNPQDIPAFNAAIVEMFGEAGAMRAAE
jgi:protease I